MAIVEVLCLSALPLTKIKIGTGIFYPSISNTQSFAFFSFQALLLLKLHYCTTHGCYSVIPRSHMNSSQP